MFITKVGDGTAFASLMFGYFFYWTIHDDFTAGLGGPGVFWPMTSLVLFLVSWVLMLAARHLNREDRANGARAALAASLIVTCAAAVAALLGPYAHHMQPTVHVYPATVWIIAIWTAAHAATGCIMQAYCLARSLAGRMTARYDQDIVNVTLYWHFLTVTAVVSLGVLGLFPAMG